MANKKTVIGIGILLLIVAAFGWYMFSRVQDNGNRIDEIRGNLQSVGEQQQRAIERLDTIERGLDDSAAEAGRISDGIGETASSIADIEGRIEASEGKLRDSASLIEEGKRILRQVRERGKVRD